MLNIMIQAYALGCLPIEEIRNFRKSIEDNNEFSFKDLGKYQNLTALLPYSLPAEIPDQRVKEKIARKLYRLRTETGTKKATADSKAAPMKDISKEIINKSSTRDTDTKNNRKTGQDMTPSAGVEKKSKDFGDIKLTSSHAMPPVRVFYLVIFTIIALVIGIVLGFLFFYEKTDVYTEQIDKLSSEVQELNTELVVHSGLLNLLEKKDTKVYPLSGSDIHPDGFGKIYLNNSSNRAYLYISGVPALPDGFRYQLWLVISDTEYPIGLFSPKNGAGYFYFTLPEVKLSSGFRFLMTEEPEGGSRNPGRKVFLTSSN